MTTGPHTDDTTGPPTAGGAPFAVDADRDGLLAHPLRAEGPSWSSFVDAAAPVATRVGSLIRIPGWAAPTITWWWASADAVGDPPTITPRARRRLEAAARRAGNLQAILAADPAKVATWPITVTGSDGTATFDSPTRYGFTRTLRDFQTAQVARLLAAGDGLNLSVPGAGKTTVAYAVWGALHAVGAVERTVVVAPISAHEVWTVEARDCFAPTARPTVTVLGGRPAGDVTVVHYEWLQNPDNLNLLTRWLTGTRSMVILDEAHRAKAGRGGIRGTAALTLAAAADHRFVLTGTPAPNGLADLAVMFDLVWAGQGRALVADPRRNRCFVRATKSELGLPPMTTLVERVPLSGPHQALYQAMIDAATTAISDPEIAGNLARIGRIVMLLLQAATDPAALLDPHVPLSMTGDTPNEDLVFLARRAASSVVPAKFVRAHQIVDANAAEGHKTLVWCSFTHHIAALTRLLADHQPAVITGATPPHDPAAATDRARELTRFRTDPACRVLLATPQTLGEGVSLHRTCTRQIHIDRTYNAGVYLQSIDRTHRLGLEASAQCTTTVLVAEGTIDERVEARLAAKVAAMAALLEDPDLTGLALPDFDDALSPVDLFLDGGNPDDLADLFAHLHKPTGEAPARRR